MSTISPIALVHALHNWSEPNSLGGNPFLPHDIVPIIAAQVLQHNREKWQQKHIRERTERARLDCSVYGMHLFSWQLGRDYKQELLNRIDQQLGIRNDLFFMWNDIYSQGGNPIATHNTPFNIRMMNRQWHEMYAI